MGGGGIAVGIEYAPDFSRQHQQPVSKPDNAEGDSRTHWVDSDVQDRQYKSCESFCDESYSEPFELEEIQRAFGSTPLQALVAERRRSTRVVQYIPSSSITSSPA